MRNRNLIAILTFVMAFTGCIRYTPVRPRALTGKNAYHSTSPASLSEYIRTVLKTSQENTKVQSEALAALFRNRPELAGLVRQILEDSGDLDSRRVLADAYIKEQFHHEALQLYQEILEKAPDDVAAELGIARIWDAWGDYSIAYPHAEHAVRLKPDSSEALELLGSICLHRNDVNGAISAFTAALQLTPDHARLLANTGYAFLLRADWNKSRSYLERALAIDPMMPEGCNNLGIVLTNLGDWPGALQYFSATNRPAAAFNNLGATYLALNRLDDARKQFRLALQIEPGYPKAMANLSDVESRLPPPTVYVIKPLPAEQAPAHARGLDEADSPVLHPRSAASWSEYIRRIFGLSVDNAAAEAAALASARALDPSQPDSNPRHEQAFSVSLDSYQKIQIQLEDALTDPVETGNEESVSLVAEMQPATVGSQGLPALARGRRILALPEPTLYTLQVYSTMNEQRAEAEARRLSAAGLRPTIIRADLRGKGIWYRVRVATGAGFKATLNAAQDLLKAGLIRSFWVDRDRSKQNGNEQSRANLSNGAQR